MGKMSRKCVEQFGERVNERLWRFAELHGIERNGETGRKLALCQLAAWHVTYGDKCADVPRELSPAEIVEVESVGKTFFTLAAAFMSHQAGVASLSAGVDTDVVIEDFMLALMLAGNAVHKDIRGSNMGLADIGSLMSELGRKGALALHENDPRQREKTFVKECWNAWQAHPENYPGKAAFARDMLSKCESLKSQTVIERWCRAWEKTTTHSR